jgi:ABC-2 type transport system permease protein
MFLIAVLFTAIGTAVGSALQDLQAFPLIMNFLMMPMFFLSGALFPVTNVPNVLHAIITINPASYGVDGLRGALLDSFAFGVGTDIVVLGVVAALVLALGSYSFSKIQI